MLTCGLSEAGFCHAYEDKISSPNSGENREYMFFVICLKNKVQIFELENQLH